MWRVTCVLVMALLATDAFGQSAPPANAAREYVLGEASGLRVVAWIKPQASAADDDWFRLEITNAGPDVVVRTAALTALGATGNDQPRDLVGSSPLDVPAHGRVGPFETFTLPAGRFTTNVPGIFIAGSLGARNFGSDVAVRLTFRAVRLDDKAPIVISAPDAITFRWSAPTTEQIQTLQRLAPALLARTFDATRPLPLAQRIRLRTLLQFPAIADSIPTDVLLAAVRRRQVADDFEFSELPGTVLFRRWQEPDVVAFYRRALIERGPEAIADLGLFANPPFDISLLEPTVALVERVSRERSTTPWDQAVTIDRALGYLDRTRTKRPDDPAIAARLSAAVLGFAPAPAPGGMYGWANMLALTHDRQLIRVLLPYLADRTPDTFTSTSSNMPSGVTPMRHAELAANAICSLLGEAPMFDPYRRPRLGPEGPAAQWAEWDKQIAALRLRIEALPEAQRRSAP